MVSGNDVYIAGDEVDNDGANLVSYATIWKNGVPTHLGVLDSNIIHGLHVSGNNVYAAGSKAGNNGYLTAAFWKNGIPTIISAVKNSQSNAIYVIDNDVYCAGVIWCNCR